MFVKHLGMEGTFLSSFTLQLANHFQCASTWFEDVSRLALIPFSQQLVSKNPVLACHPPEIDPLAHTATVVYQKCQLLGILVCDPRLPHCKK